MKYLRTAPVIRSNRLEDLYDVPTQAQQVRTYHPFGEKGFLTGRYASVVDDLGSLSYFEVDGGLLNVGAMETEVLLGLIQAGRTALTINGRMHASSGASSVFLLPGDDAIQTMEDVKAFSIRLPVLAFASLYIRARPFRQRRSLPRTLNPVLTQQLTRLTEFICQEHDSSENPSECRHLRTLRQALVRRVEDELELALEVPQIDPGYLAICQKAHSQIELASGNKSASDLAKAACCSLRQLYRAFEEGLLTTPLDYQARMKLNHARALILAEGATLTIKEVSQQSGFSSPSRFTSAYAAEFDETPRETRKRRDALLQSILEQAPKV